MFLRKLFKSENKLVWVFIDLLIVVLGVYCAFLIQEYATYEKTQKEKEEVISALKYELEFFRIQMPGQAWYSNNQATKWLEIKNEGNYYDFSSWRYIEPQYNYQVVEHGLSIQNSDIISFELYLALQEVFKQAKRIEHIEGTITQLGLRYQSIPSQAKKGTIEYEIIWSRNYDDFGRLISNMLERSQDQGLLAEKSQLALAIINEQLKPSTKKKIEESLIIEYIDDLVDNEDKAVKVVGKAFPDFTEKEIRLMYQKAKGVLEVEAAESTAQ